MKMRLLWVSVVAEAVTATAPLLTGKSESFMALERLMNRQTTRFCESIPPPYTCERSCGPGYTECVSFPTCYNPGLGQTCCSDGTYCPEGTYCTDAGCCPNDASLSECGASVTLSIIPPGTTQPPSTSTAAPPEDTATSEGPSTVHLTSSPQPTTTALSTTEEPPLSTYIPPPSNATATTTAPPVTAGAAQNAGLGVMAVIGGLGAFLMAM